MKELRASTFLPLCVTLLPPPLYLQVRVQPGAYRQWGSSAHVLPELPTHLRRFLDHPVRRV